MGYGQKIQNLQGDQRPNYQSNHGVRTHAFIQRRGKRPGSLTPQAWLYIVYVVHYVLWYELLTHF